MYFFFFIAAAPTQIYTLSLHDALPISGRRVGAAAARGGDAGAPRSRGGRGRAPRIDQPPQRVHSSVARLLDRKSTRLNSSHGYISYAVFCLKKKKYNQRHLTIE